MNIINSLKNLAWQLKTACEPSINPVRNFWRRAAVLNAEERIISTHIHQQFEETSTEMREIFNTTHIVPIEHSSGRINSRNVSISCFAQSCSYTTVHRHRHSIFQGLPERSFYPLVLSPTKKHSRLYSTEDDKQDSQVENSFKEAKSKVPSKIPLNSDKLQVASQSAITYGDNSTAQYINNQKIYHMYHPEGSIQRTLSRLDEQPEARSQGFSIKEFAEALISFHKRERKTFILGSRGGLSFRIEDVYTDLTVIDETERKERNEKKDNAQTFEEQYISTHEKLYQPKKPIPPEELFNNGRKTDAHQIRLVLRGSAGVGKTIFTEMAAIHGSEWWREFETIILIKLRNLNKENYPDKSGCYSLEEILAGEHESLTSSPSITLDRFREYIESGAAQRALLILDGLDELPFEAQSGKGPLRNALRQFSETFNHILITSRSGKITIKGIETHQWPEFEIKGFSEIHINDYIEKFYRQLGENFGISKTVTDEKIQKLYFLLMVQPILHNLVQTPINLTLVCSLFNENEAHFGSTHKFSLTGIYISTVKCLYNRFLMRPGPAQSSINDDINPTLDLTVKLIDETLQLIAWNAMQGNWSQIPVIDHYLSGDAKSLLTFLIDSGLIKSENTRWEFTHLTFQEYFAAAFLANHFIQGDVEEGRKTLQRIKFDPRYSLMLKMTAGILSDKREKGENETALEKFFDHLFSEPHDHAESYERRLIAQCCEECIGLIDFREFYTACKEYIDKTRHESQITRLLNQNFRLQNTMKEDILQDLKDQEELEKMVQALSIINSFELTLDEKIISNLKELLNNQDCSSDIKIKIIIILLNIGGQAKESLYDNLITQLETLRLDGSLQRKVIKTLIGKNSVIEQQTFSLLERIIGNTKIQGEFQFRLIVSFSEKIKALKGSKMSINEFLEELFENSKNHYAQHGSAVALLKMKEFRINLVEHIIAALDQEELSEYFKIEFVDALSKIPPKAIGFEKAKKCLEKLSFSSNIHKWLVKDISSYIKNLSAKEGKVAQEALRMTIMVVNKSNAEDIHKKMVEDTFNEIINRDCKINEKNWEKVVTIVSHINVIGDSTENSFVALSTIAEKDPPLASVVISSLSKGIESSQLDNHNKERAIDALRDIIKAAVDPSSMTALMALTRLLNRNELNEYVKICIIRALGEIVYSFSADPSPCKADLALGEADPSSCKANLSFLIIKSLLDTLESSSSNYAEEAIRSLEKISSKHLMDILEQCSYTPNDTYILIQSVCHYTYRSFVVFRGDVIISDSHQQISIECSKEIDMKKLSSTTISSEFPQIRI